VVELGLTFLLIILSTQMIISAYSRFDLIGFSLIAKVFLGAKIQEKREFGAIAKKWNQLQTGR
jgi:hypothetical protein